MTLVVASQINRGTFFRGFFFSKYLALRGHDVTLVCSGESTSRVRQRNVAGVTLVTLPYSNRLLSWLPVQLFSGALNCVRQMIDSSDVLHIFQLAMPSSWLVALMSRSLLLGRVGRVFFDWDDLWGANGVLVDYGKGVNLAATMMEERFLRLADGVTVASDFLLKRAKDVGARRVHYIPNGTERMPTSDLSKAGFRKLLGIPGSGTILCHVGMADLDRMWKKISTVFPNTTLIIIGDPPRYNMRNIRKANAPGMIYTGRISSDLVKKYLSAADILLLKTNDEISERARFPIRLSEYLCASRPIVAGDIGEIGNVLRKTGCALLSKPGDDEDFANRTLELIASPETWDEIGVKARSVADKLSWVDIAQRLEKAYTSN